MPSSNAAQNLIALWREKCEALSALSAHTEKMLQRIDEESYDDIGEDVEQRASMMRTIEAMDGKAAIWLRMIGSTPAGISGELAPDLREALTALQAQMREILNVLNEMDGRLRAAVSNRITELKDEIKDTKSQITVNKGYNLLSDSTDSKFDVRN